MQGLILNIYRNTLGDCTAGGVSSKAVDALLVGPGVPQIFDPLLTRPVLRLHRTRYGVRLVPDIYVNYARDNDMTFSEALMFGGNFGWTSDSRFQRLIESLGHQGPVPIHDRIER